MTNLTLEENIMMISKLIENQTKKEGYNRKKKLLRKIIINNH